MRKALTQIYSHLFPNLFPNNRLVETCCHRMKHVCCRQVRCRSDNELAADLTITIRDRSVGTRCNNLLISSDLLQVALSDLLILVSNRSVASCSNKPPQLCRSQLGTDLFPQACSCLRKITGLS